MSFYYRVTIFEMFRFFIELIHIHTCHQRNCQHGDCNNSKNLGIKILDDPLEILCYLIYFIRKSSN